MVERAEHVGVERLLPVLELEVVEATPGVLECRYLDERVDPSEPGTRGFDQSRARCRITDVGHLRDDALPGGVELGGDGLEGLLGAGGHHHLGAVAEGGRRALTPEPLTDTGHHHCLAIEQGAHRILLTSPTIAAST